MAGIWRRCSLGILAVLLAAQAIVAQAAFPAQSADLSPGESLAYAALNPSDCAHPKRQWLRQKVVCESDLERYGLRLDDNWRRVAVEQPVVILVHGFNSSPDQNAAFWRAFRDEKLPCGTFAYPNDHTIQESAQLLSCELRRFATLHPRRRVVLVCHSMGSLVARACLEDSLLDPKNVDRLIMIAPPTHGSMIAHFAVGTDLWEHWLSRRDGGPWRRMRDSIVDGLGEAADELRPGSEFLVDLNARPLNPRVRYTILLGTGARLNDEQLAWIRDSVCDKLAKMPGGDRSAERLAAILNDIDELVDGKGDGVVAVKRGRLDGVSDTLILPFGHLAVTGEPRNEVLLEVQQAVLARVR